MREIRTSGLMSGDGKRSVAAWPKPPRPSSTLQFLYFVRYLALSGVQVEFSDYRWHFWARIWRTPILGEASMALMNRLTLARELNRGSGRPLGREHIERTWA